MIQAWQSQKIFDVTHELLLCQRAFARTASILMQRARRVQIQIGVARDRAVAVGRYHRPNFLIEISGMHDVIAGVHAGSEHVFQQQRIVSVEGDQRIITLLNGGRNRRPSNVAELTNIELVNAGLKIGYRVLQGTRRDRLEHELILPSATG